MREPIARLLKHNRLISNFFFLSLVQGVSLIVPLVILPYLLNIIGVTNFGLVSFFQSFMFLLALIVDFGFNIGGTRKISINRNDPDQLNKIYSTIFLAKLVLVGVSLVFLVAIFFLPRFNSNPYLYCSSFAIVIGQAFLPTWVYMGLEKMRDYAVFNVLGKLLYLISIFLLVKSPDDFTWVNLLLGGSTLITSFASFFHLRYKHNIRFVKPILRQSIIELRQSAPLFLTSVSINTMAYSNAVILGLFTGYQEVGLFSIAEKVSGVFRQAPAIFSQVLYPAGCKAASHSLHEYQSLLRKSYLPFIYFFLALCVAGYLYAGQLVLYFHHQPSELLLNLIRILIVAVFINALNIPAYQTMLSFNFTKTYSTILLICSAISVLVNFVLSSAFKLWGTTVNVLLTEILIALAMYSILHYRHKNFSLLNSSSYV